MHLHLGIRFPRIYGWQILKNHSNGTPLWSYRCISWSIFSGIVSTCHWQLPSCSRICACAFHTFSALKQNRLGKWRQYVRTGCRKAWESHFLAKNAIRYVCSLPRLSSALYLFCPSIFLSYTYSSIKRLSPFHGKTLRHCCVAYTEFDSDLTCSSGTGIFEARLRSQLERRLDPTHRKFYYQSGERSSVFFGYLWNDFWFSW